MKTSQKGIDLIKHFEGLHDGDLNKIGLQPKLCPANIWTVGYGHAIYDNGRQLRGENPNDKIRAYQLYETLTEKEAENLLAKDLITYENMVLKTLKVEVNQNQFDALVSHTYNCGLSTTLYYMINTKSNIEDIAFWWINHYVIGGGKRLKGLELRRNAECELFTSNE